MAAAKSGAIVLDNVLRRGAINQAAKWGGDCLPQFGSQFVMHGDEGGGMKDLKISTGVLDEENPVINK